MFFLFFNDTATTEIYTLSLHDALPIYSPAGRLVVATDRTWADANGNYVPDCDLKSPLASGECGPMANQDRKSTRLNSSHQIISYAVFCLKKKKKTNKRHRHLAHSPTHT